MAYTEYDCRNFPLDNLGPDWDRNFPRTLTYKISLDFDGAMQVMHDEHKDFYGPGFGGMSRRWGWIGLQVDKCLFKNNSSVLDLYVDAARQARKIARQEFIDEQFAQLNQICQNHWRQHSGEDRAAECLREIREAQERWQHWPDPVERRDAFRFLGTLREKYSQAAGDRIIRLVENWPKAESQ